MKTTFISLFIVALTIQATSALSEDVKPLDYKAIGNAAGTTATVQADGVVRIGWKRDDVPVTIDGMKLPPPAGLGSWAAFMALPGNNVMTMGDTVVFEDEITTALDAAFAHGLEITALHNHFIYDRPPVFFMHISGHGSSASELAEGVKAMWDAIKAVRTRNSKPVDRFAGEPPQITGKYPTQAMEKILGTKGNLNGEVLKFTFGRSAKVHGVDFGTAMGLSTWAAFSGNEKQAVVDGDFAMTAEEIQPVMHALRKADIHIVALHNHMVEETPAYYFLHYWGKGDPTELARGVRSALDTQ